MYKARTLVTFSPLFIPSRSLVYAYPIRNRWIQCADIARIALLYNHGGIYLDTDMWASAAVTPLYGTLIPVPGLLSQDARVCAPP